MTRKANKNFWSGFAAGAATGLGALFAVNFIGRGGKSRIIRLEKSVQIGRPVHQVFDAWSDFNRLAQMSSIIQSVRRFGDRSHWLVTVNGKSFEWDAEITQMIPNQAIGWKAVSGTKTSGRITFSPVNDETLVHVQMNYVPPSILMRPFASSITGQIEGVIEQALRDFKHAIESREPAVVKRDSEPQVSTSATGTYGPGDKQNTRFGSPSVPVEFTRPPEAKS